MVKFIGEISVMRKLNILLILPISVLSLVGIGRAQTTVTAASCSQSVVQAAVTSAGRGGTVNVPAGNCTWSSTLTLTSGVTLAGKGVGSTVITSSNTVLISNVPDSTAIANGENIKITGFTFDGGGSQDVLIAIQGESGISGKKPYCCYVIGNNKFQNTSPTSSNGVIQAGGNGNGQLRGVIYSNTFDRTNIPMRLFSNNDTREWANTAFNNFSFGTADNLYFEDNTIQYSSAYAGNNPGWIEIGQGARLAARYNSWNLANATTPQEDQDIHGFQNWSGTVNSGQTGSMMIEYYGNSLSNMGTYRWIDHRGGIGMFFDNVMNGSGGGIDIYGMSVPGSCPSQISPAPTNYNPLVYNTYFFNNTQSGTNILANMNPSGNPTACSVTENSNWWNYNASCTASSCTAGVGSGTTAPTGACTTGVGYWVASTPSATASSSTIQSGALYKCTSTNTWTKYYTPYTYPHPLRTNSNLAQAPAPPTNLSGVVQ
jgi:hypothetical protein